MHLNIPALRERNSNHDQYLPATEQHPHAQGPFRTVPVSANPQLTDLGLWNVFANPDFLAPQRRIRRILCADTLIAGFPGLTISPVVSTHSEESFDRLLDSPAFAGRCNADNLLPKTIALFKTPGLRDLGHSAPYMHTGQFDSLEQIVGFYRIASDLARRAQLRNGDRELNGIILTEADVAPLTAFLESLNEDYE